MSALSRIPEKDLETLSAYLDDELGKKEAERVEARLAREPALKQALEALRGTAELLGSLPQLSSPRSFALTPETVQVRPRRTAFPILQFSTALATLAFFVVVGADLLTSQLSASLVAQDRTEFAREAAAPAAALPEADQAVGELALQAESESMAISPSPPPAGTQAAEQPEAMAAAGEEAEREPVEAPPAEVVEEDAVAATAEGERAEYRAEGEGIAAGTPEPPQDGAAGAEETAQKVELLPEVEGPTPTYFDEPETGESTVHGSAGLNLLRILEVTLGAAAVGLGTLTIRARRNR